MSAILDRKMIGNFELIVSVSDNESIVKVRNQSLPEDQAYRDYFLLMAIFSKYNYDAPVSSAVDFFNSVTLADIEDWYIEAYLCDALESLD